MMMATEKPSIAERVRAFREGKGLTQEQLAAAAGMTASGVARIEQGGTEDPRVMTLRALAKALGVTLDELAGE